MNQRNVFRSVYISLLLLAVIISMGSGHALTGAPAWVKQGSSALKTAEGRIFHGVGSAPVMGSLPLQESVADNRARDEIKKILTSYLHSLWRDFNVSGQTQEEGTAQAKASQEINKISKDYFSEVPVMDHWRDMNNGVVYAVAELTMEQVKLILSQAKAVNEGLKAHVKVQGDAVFDRFAQGKK